MERPHRPLRCRRLRRRRWRLPGQREGRACPRRRQCRPPIAYRHHRRNWRRSWWRRLGSGTSSTPRGTGTRGSSALSRPRRRTCPRSTSGRSSGSPTLLFVLDFFSSSSVCLISWCLLFFLQYCDDVRLRVIWMKKKIEPFRSNNQDISPGAEGVMDNH